FCDKGGKGRILSEGGLPAKQKGDQPKRASNNHRGPSVSGGSYRMLRQRYQPRAMAFNPPGDFELEQSRADGRWGYPHLPHQVVDRHRRWTEQRDETVALVICRKWIMIGWDILWRLAYRATGVLSQYGFNRGNNVARFGHRDCALLEQAIGALAARVK